MSSSYICHFVDCEEGARLALHSYGGCGPSLLLLHCNGISARAYEPMIQSLTDSFQVYAADLRGHGSSAPLPTGASLDWELIAKDVLSAVGHLNLQNCFVVAHSLGGGTALRVEELQPGTFAGMFLFEPIAPPPGNEPFAVGSRRLAAGARKRRRRFPSLDDAAAAYRSKPPLSILDSRCLDLYVKHGFRETADGDVELACTPEVEAAIFEGSWTALAGAYLDRVACPVVVGVGGLDAHDGPALIAPGIAGQIRRGTLQRFPNLGHFGPLQEPEAMAAAVKSALLGRGGPPTTAASTPRSKL